MSEPNEVHIGHGAPPDPTIIGNSLPRLRALSELDRFKVADDDPDIRGWIVRGANGETIGRVHDLLAEMDTRQVRYLDIAVSGDTADDERHILIPIGLARLNDDASIVSLGSLTREELLALPPYEHRTFTRDDECELIGRLQGLGRPADDTPDLYRHAVFAMSGFWGTGGGAEEAVTYDIIEVAGGNPSNDENR
jgi:PRC-barrel domain protein